MARVAHSLHLAAHVDCVHNDDDRRRSTLPEENSSDESSSSEDDEPTPKPKPVAAPPRSPVNGEGGILDDFDAGELDEGFWDD